MDGNVRVKRARLRAGAPPDETLAPKDDAREHEGYGPTARTGDEVMAPTGGEHEEYGPTAWTGDMEVQGYGPTARTGAADGGND